MQEPYAAVVEYAPICAMHGELGAAWVPMHMADANQSGNASLRGDECIFGVRTTREPTV